MRVNDRHVSSYYELEILNNIYCHVINTDELLEVIK